jgi:hypothetical protein
MGHGVNIRVTVGNDSVKTDLVEVGGLELQHLVNTTTVDLVGSIANLLGSTLTATETGLNELLAVLVEQVEGVEVGTGGDLDQLCETVADLGIGKRAEESEVKEGVHGSVVGTKTVLVVGVVDTNLDRDGSVNETNNGGGDTDEVGVSAVRSTSESVNG